MGRNRERHQDAVEHTVVINACTLGFIATDLTLQFASGRVTSPEDMGMKSPREGANSAIFLLLG